MEGWSAIYLRDALGLSVLVGASGVALFHGAMTIGRLATAGAARGVGRDPDLMFGGVAVIGGMLLVLLASEPLLVLAGIVVVGLGLSGVAPIAFSLAGDASGGRAGQASSVITDRRLLRLPHRAGPHRGHHRAVRPAHRADHDPGRRRRGHARGRRRRPRS